MNVALALGAIAGFFVCLRLLKVPAGAMKAIRLSREAVGILRSAEVPEEMKEATARRLSVDFLGMFVSITSRTVAAVLVPAALIFLLGVAGFISAEGVVDALNSWLVILLSLALIPVMLVRRR